MAKFVKVITWARWKVLDSFDSDHYSVFTASILKPSWEYPVACAVMSIVRGRQRLFMRMLYEHLCQVFVIPEEYRERLKLGNEAAESEAEYIRDQQKKLHKMSGLQPGSHIIRTDTGEIIAEAERIIKENENLT